MSEGNAAANNVLRKWVRATWLGWILGVPLIVALALLGEAVGVGGVQVIVGAGMGAGVGLMQSRAIRPVLGKSSPWFWSCVIGLAAPFLVWDLMKAMEHELAYSLQWSVAAGGLLMGIWQALLLRARLAGAHWWIAASVAGWALASALSAAADLLQRSQARGIWGALAYLVFVAAGGLVLGLITGLALTRLSRAQPAAGMVAAH